MTEAAALLPETTLAILQVQALLEAHESDACPEVDPQILDYLTRHAIVLLCNEMEREVTSLLFARVEEAGDPAVSSLVRTVRAGLLRNARPDEIGKRLANLDPRCKAVFKEEFQMIDERGRSLLGLIVNKRDDIAHNTQPGVSFDELVEAVDAAAAVLSAAQKAIDVTRTPGSSNEQGKGDPLGPS